MGRKPKTGTDDVVPMTGMDDVERQTLHGDTEILEKKNKAARDCRVLCVATIFSVVLTACLIVALSLFGFQAHYYVAIDSVSGLAPTSTTTGELSFNLTLGLSSWGLAARSCFEPGAYAQVSYRDVPLAASDAGAAGTRLCGKRGKSVELHVSTARVTGVAVEGLMDGLTADVRQGMPVFDVTLHLPAGSYGGDNWVSACRGISVGAAAAVSCDNPN